MLVTLGAGKLYSKMHNSQILYKTQYHILLCKLFLKTKVFRYSWRLFNLLNDILSRKEY